MALLALNVSLLLFSFLKKVYVKQNNQSLTFQAAAAVAQSVERPELRSLKERGATELTCVQCTVAR